MDPNILKIYMLVQDVYSSRRADGQGTNVMAVYNQLQAKYSARLCRLLCINSSDHVADASILQQFVSPSAARYPLYFPESSPYAMSNGESLSVYFQLTMEDMHAMHSLCYDLYTLEIIPALERRIETLSKFVSDHRKGVRSVLRSFWRKPTESPSRGGDDEVRYRYDSSEGQTLLLGDTFFILRDYEAALATYKLLREDFKADGSVAHYGYICVMMGACHLMIEPKYGGKDLNNILKAFREFCFPGSAIFLENSPYASAILGMALVCASMHSNPMYVTPKARLDAASLLLSAAFYSRHYLAVRRNGGAGSAYSFITAFLTEKAAQCFIQMKLLRKYAFYLTVAGKTYLSCADPPGASRHALALFGAASTTFASDNWTSLESGLTYDIVNCLRSQPDGDRRVMLLYLYTLRRKLFRLPVSTMKDNLKHLASDRAAATALLNIMDSVDIPDVRVLPSWRTMSIVDCILSPLPLELPSAPNRSGLIEIEDLWIPLVDVEKIELLAAVNGTQLFSSKDLRNDSNCMMSGLISLSREAELEYSILNGESGSSPDMSKFVYDLAELDDLPYKLQWRNEYSLGEEVKVLIEWANPFPSTLTLTNIQLLVENDEQISSDLSSKCELCLQAFETKHVSISLHPTCPGSYTVCGVQWVIDGRVKVINSIMKRGALLQKSLHERSTRARSEDTSLCFSVVQAKPVLQATVDGLPESVSDGEMANVCIRISNEGNVEAKAIVLKLHQAIGVLLLDGRILKPEGLSRSVFRLPETLSLPPNASTPIQCALRFDRHCISENNAAEFIFGCGVVCTEDMLAVSSQGNRRWGLFSKSVGFTSLRIYHSSCLIRYQFRQKLKLDPSLSLSLLRNSC